jgi:hypothetical protein
VAQSIGHTAQRHGDAIDFWPPSLGDQRDVEWYRHVAQFANCLWQIDDAKVTFLLLDFLIGKHQ